MLHERLHASDRDDRVSLRYVKQVDMKPDCQPKQPGCGE